MIRHLRHAALLSIVLLSIGAASPPARRASAPPGVDPTLAAEARIGMKTAKATALARVPGGRIRSSELEREKGKLIYSFDIVARGKPGIEEVNVDAIHGQVLSVHHEGPREERAEALKDKAEAKAKAPVPHR